MSWLPEVFKSMRLYFPKNLPQKKPAPVAKVEVSTSADFVLDFSGLFFEEDRFQIGGPRAVKENEIEFRLASRGR